MGSASETIPDYLKGLNPVQLDAVRHTGGPLLILAGAGSGKTRVITYKIAYLIRAHGIPPHSILAVTFTNKAAAEMRERAASLAPGAVDCMIRTFHSFGAWLLRRNHDRCGLPSGFSIYDDDDVVQLLRSLFPDESKPHLTAQARAISRAKDYALYPTDDLRAITHQPEELRDVYQRYHERLREIGNVDFGDLILRPLELLRSDEGVRRRIQQRFQVVLVDEYQDSNVAQFEFLSSLVGPDSYLCVVGDDDQSIYRFRGAEVRNILTFHEQFPGTTTVRLEQNYRSTGSILNLASAVVAKNEGRLGKRLWTEREDGPVPQLALLSDAESEVEFCCTIIERDRRYSDTAILYRTNAQSRLFESEFLRLGIPYRIVGTLRFYEREEVKDVLAVLRLLANPRDEVSFRRVINKPSRGLGVKSVDRLVEAAVSSGSDLLAVLSAPVAGLTRRAESARASVASIFAGLSEAVDGSSLSVLVERAAEETGLREYHESQDEYQGSGKVANIDELINAAGLYGAGREALAEFLEMIELDANRDTQDSDGEAVTLITMHNTKGLEFPRVFITGLEDGLFPRGADESAAEIEEERRLFYVAVTRAENELYLTSCRYRRLYGRITEYMPSRFLGEIPEHLLEHVGSGSPKRRPPTPGSAGGPGFGRQGIPGHHADGPEEDWQEAEDLPPGTGVYHEDYGLGVVQSRWRKGTNIMVRVGFENGRTATFIPRYTPLERVSIDE
ncbi:MAG: ATP-dependent helicase [bacterium]